jgi:hypothetical protein
VHSSNHANQCGAVATIIKLRLTPTKSLVAHPLKNPPQIRILPLDIGKVCGRIIEALRQRLGDQHCDRRLGGKKRGGVVKFVQARTGDGPHRGGMRLAEKNRHLSDEGARLGHIGNHSSVLDHFKLTVDQHIEPTSRLALANDLTSDGKAGFPSAGAMLKNCAHSQNPQVD